MSYIYHLKPNPMNGDHLIPLNKMNREDDLYKLHVNKYVGREELLKQFVPKLNCLWNDVVQFSALNPQLIVNELRKIEPELKPGRFEYFKVRVDQVVGKYESVVFDRVRPRQKGEFTIDDDEVTTFDTSYCELERVPEATIHFWKRAKAQNGKLLWFPFVPHILVKGIIDTKNFETCNLY